MCLLGVLGLLFCHLANKVTDPAEDMPGLGHAPPEKEGGCPHYWLKQGCDSQFSLLYGSLRSMVAWTSCSWVGLALWPPLG